MSRRKRRRKKAHKPGPTGPAEPAQPTWRDRLASRADTLARTRWFLPAALVLLTFALYARSIDDPLIYWDDEAYVRDDKRIQQLSPGNVWRIVTRPYIGNYHPLTTFTFAFDRAVWGEWLPGFHLTQLAFYAGGVVLLYFVFRTIFGSAPAAFAGAAIYAAHAIHVESVAWLASRKDVVCLFFYAAAILAYIRYAREESFSGRRYAAFLALAAAAMFSKGYAAVLPAVLLAYDWCIGGKIGRRRILDKLPLFALALFLTVVMVLAQERDATPLPPGLTWWLRFVTLCKVYAAYVGRTLLPVRLSVHYAVSESWSNPAAAVLGALLGAGSVAGFFALRRRAPAAAFGIAVFVLQLGTVMNTFFHLRTWMTDRFLFFPTIGTTLALAAGGLWLYRRKGLPKALRRWGVPAAAVAAVALYVGLTVSRIGAWKSEVDIWSDAVRKQMGLRGSGPLALDELCGKKTFDLHLLQRVRDAYERAGRHDEARAFMELIEELAAAGTVSDFYVMINLARCDIESGRYDEVIRKLRPIAEQGKPSAADAWFWIGEAHKGKGEREEARAAYEKALGIYRKRGRRCFKAMFKLGRLDLEAGRYEEAARWFRRARKDAPPTDPLPIFNLALALEGMGQVEEAYRLCEETLKLDGRISPIIKFDFTEVHAEIGVIAQKLGRPEEAVVHFEEALRRSPDHPRREAIRARIKDLVGGNEIRLAHGDIEAGRYDEAIRRLRPIAKQGKSNAADAWISIGEAHRRKGEREEARAAFERALESYSESGRPGFKAMVKLGGLAFRAERYEEAARWFRRAREDAPPTDPRPIFNLALSLERTGQIEEAYRLCEETLKLEGRTPPGVPFDFTEVHVETGILAEKLGRPEEAVEHFEEGLRRSPDHPKREAIRAGIKNLRKRLRVPP